jgi:hypothetical protein
MSYRIFIYVMLQIMAPISLIFFAGNWLGDGLAYHLIGLESPHDFVKQYLESSQGLLLRQREVLFSGIVFAILITLSNWLVGKHKYIALLGISIVVCWFFPMRSRYTLISFAVIIGAAACNEKSTQWLRFIPYSLLLFPNVLFARVSPVLKFSCIWIIAFLANGVCVWIDCLLSYEIIREEMEEWPVELLDDRIMVRAQDPAHRADWHGVDIIDDHAFIIAEETMRLMAFPMDKGDPIAYKLGERWGHVRAAPLDMEYDPRSKLFWLVDNETEIAGYSFNSKQGWKKKATQRLPTPMYYTYMRMYKDKMLIAPIQVKGRKGPDFLIVLGENFEWNKLRVVHNDPSPIRLPYPREIEFIGSMDKLAIAPDFGKEIFLFDIRSGKAERLIESPTLDGKMRWVEKLDRLFVAFPNRMEIWVINPHTKSIDWKIPTQPGVRSLAIDAERGILVNASVLTGQILVQNIHTGEILDRLGTVMPMVRELALDTVRGQAVLTTWAAVYQFPYTDNL